MRVRSIVATMLCLFLLHGTQEKVLAARTQDSKPSITFVSPRDGAVIHGTSMTVHVAVHDFKLVPPVYLNPSLLPGKQGHIHYYLDNLKNFVATRDAATALSFVFRDLVPGRHTVFAYLATSQHAKFPGTRIASVHFVVAAAPKAATTLAAPELSVMGVQSQNTKHGATVVVRVAVKHFKLVQPVYKNPSLLRGNQGHIHYALDSIANFVATRDAVTAMSHPWTNVSAGPHAILVYLATSQHQHVPGTPVLRIPINVAGAPGKRLIIRVAGRLPKTGGADSGGMFPQLPLLLMGILTVLLGLATRTALRRFQLPISL